MRNVNIKVDFKKFTGDKIKPLHGVNNSPLSMFEPPLGFKEAGIPFCRLHDTGGAFGGAHFVDIPNVFPDFNSDPENPDSYDFAFTDAYLTQLNAAGTEIFYRLGVTIENNYRIKSYHNRPPKDFLKWARIAEHIIKHYNEGWANGFHFNIRYWEIWNEPENPPMWSGTPEEFYEFYRISANYLKQKFPELKIGGYAGCGFRAITRSNCSNFHKSFVTFFHDFIKYITSESTSAPLDFFSYHNYTLDPQEIKFHAEYADKILKEYGLDNTEQIFNEWNYVGRGYETMKRAEGASFVASIFCVMQDSHISKSMYYDAYPAHGYCGLYNFPDISTTQTYSVFFMWNKLYCLKNRCYAAADSRNIYVCAASDFAEQAVFISNFNNCGCNIDFDMQNNKKMYAFIIDKRHDNVPYEFNGNVIYLPPYATVILATEKNYMASHAAAADTSVKAGLAEPDKKNNKTQKKEDI